MYRSLMCSLIVYHFVKCNFILTDTEERLAKIQNFNVSFVSLDALLLLLTCSINQQRQKQASKKECNSSTKAIHDCTVLTPGGPLQGLYSGECNDLVLCNFTPQRKSAGGDDDITLHLCAKPV